MRNLKKQHNLSTFFVQSIDIDPSGYLVPEEFERQIVMGLDEANVVRGLAKVITTSAERKIPVAATHSAAQWTAENTIPDLNIRKGPGTDYGKTGKYTGVGTFTIVEEADGKGASKWGLLKSYQGRRNGWVSLDYAKRV